MTVPDAETLRRLYEDEGHSVREIARLARCRTQALLEAMDAAGIARRRRGPRRAPLPNWDRDKLLQLVKVKGLPYARAFARRNHVSREKLAVLLGRPRLARGPAARQVLVEHDDAIRAAYERGVPIKSLATHYGSTVRAISYSLDRTSGKQPETRTEDAALASGCFPTRE